MIKRLFRYYCSLFAPTFLQSFCLAFFMYLTVFFFKHFFQSMFNCRNFKTIIISLLLFISFIILASFSNTSWLGSQQVKGLYESSAAWALSDGMGLDQMPNFSCRTCWICQFSFCEQHWEVSSFHLSVWVANC